MKKLAIAAAIATASFGAQAATYSVSGASQISFSGLAIPVTITGGSYDDASGAGNWTLDVDLAVFAQPVMHVGQSWTMDSASGTGTLAPPSTCTGVPSTTCTALSGSFQGAWSTTGPVGAGNYAFLLPGTPAGDVTFNVTLTPNSTNPVPVPAAAWLFGSALLGLAGVGRRRAAK